jgi:hypothetical protein
MKKGTNDAIHDASTTPMDAGLRRMIRAHLWYGMAGLVLGLAAAMASITWGADYLQASPLFTIIALAIVCTIAVSMLGGLLTYWSDPEAELE